MRNTKLSAQEILEMDESKRKEARDRGFRAMPIRDRGRVTLSNGVRLHWHTDTPPTHLLSDGDHTYEVTSSTIPNGSFGIEFDKEMIIVDAEELRKYLRWA